MQVWHTPLARTCARAKGGCQTCILDLDYNVPVQVRDAAAGAAPQEAPRSAVHREWHAQQLERLMAEEDAGGAGAGGGGGGGGGVGGGGGGRGRGGQGTAGGGAEQAPKARAVLRAQPRQDLQLLREG